MWRGERPPFETCCWPACNGGYFLMQTYQLCLGPKLTISYLQTLSMIALQCNKTYKELWKYILPDVSRCRSSSTTISKQPSSLTARMVTWTAVASIFNLDRLHMWLCSRDDRGPHLYYIQCIAATFTCFICISQSIPSMILKQLIAAAISHGQYT
ncbi:hypothetical protein BC629DRAFT_311760 [Irpex lacteus]|nr:hypothetical protein BC629DRAFT_311760 [Irpex lacteus]